MHGHCRMWIKARFGILAFVLLQPWSGGAQTALPADLTQMSLEDLMQIEVTSVSKKEQRAWKSGAAVYVITQEDIRRSGAANIPDVLRMVPGVNVARINANTWAISIRGFNYRYATKLLVLVDGRTVYTPGFSGVYWDQQNVPLENVDRIEVIRGPGGTVWGANAVNGVINIITKSSKDTQGGLVVAGTGSEENGRGLVQYGGKAGADGFYRVYGNYFNVASGALANGGPGVDGWHALQAGFRSDWTLSPQDSLTVQGDYNGSSEGQALSLLFSNNLPALNTFADKIRVGSENLLGRWNHEFSNGSEADVLIYYDRYRRFDMGLNIVNTGNVDAQYRFRLGTRQDVVAGVGYRLTDQSFDGGYNLTLGTGWRRDNLGSAFLQDEISLAKTVSLTVGSKIEHNAYTGFEYEPSAQLVWTPNDRHSVWTSVARAIQQPSWVENSMQLDLSAFPTPGGGFGVSQLQGNPQIEEQEVLDFEVGYRTRLSRRLSVDLTGFLSHYSKVETLEPGTPYFTFTPAPAHFVFPSIYDNLAHARTYGGEAAFNWNLTNQWRLSPGFSFLQMQVAHDPGAPAGATVSTTPGDSPKIQWQLRSLWNFRPNLQWDTSAYYVGPLQGGSPTGGGPVPSYTRVDTRLGWHIGETTDLSVTGQNLLSPRHWEFTDGLFINPTQTERSFVVTLTTRF
jgi:iron complex outermembrane receptor protein